MDAQSFLEDNQNNESDMDLEETLALKRTNHENVSYTHKRAHET